MEGKWAAMIESDSNRSSANGMERAALREVHPREPLPGRWAPPEPLSAFAYAQRVEQRRKHDRTRVLEAIQQVEDLLARARELRCVLRAVLDTS